MNSLIIPVYVFRKSHPELKVKVYALLDDASDTTFIKTDVKDKLGIPGVNSKLILSTMLGIEEINVCRVELKSSYPGHTPETRYHQEETRFLVLKLQLCGHISKRSKTRLCRIKKAWKSDC